MLRNYHNYRIPLIPSGARVETVRSLRRMGRDIPRGTEGTITHDFYPDDTSEIRIRTEYGAFVVGRSEIARVQLTDPDQAALVGVLSDLDGNPAR